MIKLKILILITTTAINIAYQLAHDIAEGIAETQRIINQGLEEVAKQKVINQALEEVAKQLNNQ